MSDLSDLVLREDGDGVAVLTLNRPDALNALSPSMFVALRAHVDAIAGQTETVGVVVLRGAGRSFSAGNDLKALAAGDLPPHPDHQKETIAALEALPQPVIVAVQGHCYTGALELALGSDLIVAAESAKFADTHGKFHMTPGWGMSQRLPRRVGIGKAKEMSYTARVVGGREAAEIGLAIRCVPDERLEVEVMELARSMAGLSWWSMRGNKMLYNRGQDYGYAEGLAFEGRARPGRAPEAAESIKAAAGR